MQTTYHVRVGKRTANSFHGFTLIELLVVIAIIAILASMVLPALAKAKSMSQKAQCYNNLKQTATAMEMFGDDFNGYLPPGPQNPYTGTNIVYGLDEAQYCHYDNTSISGLLYYLAPYFHLPSPTTTSNFTSLFVCPAAAALNIAGYPMAVRPYYGVYVWQHSTLSSILPIEPFGYWNDSGTYVRTNSYKINQVGSWAPLSQTWAMTEVDRLGSPSAGWKAEIPPAPIHNNHRSYLYFDGHVETLIPTVKGFY